MRDLAGHEREGAFDQREQRIVRIAARIEFVVVEPHPRVGDEIERGAVRKRNSDRGPGAGLNDIAFENRIADMKRYRDAIADGGNVAHDFFDFADAVGRHARLRLRVFSGCRRASQQPDHVAGQCHAIRRNQCRRMLAREISWNNKMAAVGTCQDQIGAGAVIRATDKQLGVWDQY